MPARFVVLLFAVTAPSTFFFAAAAAHPASGIVVDATGQVFLFTRNMR